MIIDIVKTIDIRVTPNSNMLSDQRGQLIFLTRGTTLRSPRSLGVLGPIPGDRPASKVYVVSYTNKSENGEVNFEISYF